MNLSERLASGIAALGLVVDVPAQERLLRFLDLLVKWNRVHNLTAVREPERMIAQHLLDSLSILPQLNGAVRVVDVGSGGGLPGIPLAVARPDFEVTLLDSSHKKCAFQRQVQAELGLANISVACARVETWKPGEHFDIVVSRAFADLGEFAQLAGHLLQDQGRLLAMKGVYPYEEIARLPSGYSLAKVVPLKVPHLDAERHLVILTRKVS
jgi:16S rRNA (guanine527-N7)-methyltransferase